MPQKRSKKHSKKRFTKKKHTKRPTKVTQKNIGGRGSKKNMEPLFGTKLHWRQQTPMTKKQRSQMPSHCLLDPVRLRYPVCKKGSSVISCIGLQAAEKRARLQDDLFIQQKAKQLQKSYC